MRGDCTELMRYEFRLVDVFTHFLSDLRRMTFGPDAEKGGRITSLDEYKRHLDHFQAQGYNEIDTARVSPSPPNSRLPFSFGRHEVTRETHLLNLT